MRTIFILFLLYFVEKSNSLAINADIRQNLAYNDNSEIGVYDGNKTSISKHPYMVVLVDIVDSVQICSCTIVSPQWVVTVADCVDEYTANDFYILAGSQDGQSGQQFFLQKIIKHPKYKQMVYDYDYACLKTKKPFVWSRNVMPIKLPKQKVEVGTKLTVAGWGSTTGVDSDGDTTPLKEGIMIWQEKEVCKATYDPFGVVLTDRLGCAYNKNKTTLCSGDYGGAFVKDGVIYGMLAVKATAGWCTRTAVPVLVADVTPGAQWIKNITRAEYENDRYIYGP